MVVGAAVVGIGDGVGDLVVGETVGLAVVGGPHN